MDPNGRYATIGVRFLLLVALLFTGAFFLFRPSNTLVINTDLKDLSPRLSHNQQLQQAINQLSASIENRFILLLASPDDETLAEAHEALVKNLSALPHLSIAGGEAFLDNFAAELAPHRFRLLTNEQQRFLEDATDAEITALATTNLYQLSGAVRVLPIHRDPFGWFGDYLLESFDGPPGSESPGGTIERVSDQGAAVYYQPIVVNIDRGALELSTQQQLATTLKQVELEIKQEFPELEIFHSGVFFFAANAATESRQDISLIGIGSLVGIVVLLLFAFSSLWPLILPFVSIAIGVSVAFAVIYTFFGSVHIITIVFGASLIGIVIDYSLHYFYHQAGSSAGESKSHHDLHLALFFSLVTSVIGYSALSFSSLASLQQVALFSCVGLIAAWLSVVGLAPLLIRRSITVNRTLLPAVVNIFNRPIYRIAPFSVYIFTALFIGSTALVIIGLPTSDSPREIFSPPQSLLDEDRVVSEVTNDFEPGKYLVVTGNRTQDIFDHLQELHSLVSDEDDDISSLDTVDHLTTDHLTTDHLTADHLVTDNSVTDQLVTIDHWLPSPDRQRQNYTLQARLYGHTGLAVEWLRELDVDAKLIMQLQDEYRHAENKALEPADILKKLSGAVPTLWLEHAGQQYSFALIRKGTDTSALQTAASTMDGVEFIDTAAMATTALMEQRRSSSIVLIAAYFLIAILLVLRYRNIKALTMLAVPLGATMVTVLVLFAAGQPFTVFHSMAMFLVLGLGMDYVIFVAEMKKNREATLNAVFLSAVTSLLSFGLLSLSSLTVVSAFGLTVLIGNTANLIGTVIFSWERSLPDGGGKIDAAVTTDIEKQNG